METINKKNLKDVFLNVRKSYRLLFEYQSKLLNLVKYIGDYFSYSYVGGYPKFSDPCPKKGKGYLDNWAWDWLNMYVYAFYFGSKQIQEKEIFFEIRIYSDTGYYDSKIDDQLKIEAYTDLSLSKTKIVLIAGTLGWNTDELLEEFNSSNTEYKIQDNDVNMCAKSYDLEDFIDEESTNGKLKDFTKYCITNRIMIKYEL